MSFTMMDDAAVEGTKIKVIGIGGAGGNVLNNMITREMRGQVDFIAANTDRQALEQNLAEQKIPLGSTGLGAGARPEVGAQAANEAREQIAEKLRGANMLFITAGMGGGTGTGAAPIVAEVAQELGILTVAIVTKPFSFEGKRRMKVAETGLKQLKNRVHSLIVILNDKLEEELGPDATIRECFLKADEVLYNACSGIAEIIEAPGLVNVDFEDVRSVMSERGTAMMGSGEAEGADRAVAAASQAISCPLLESVKLNGARGVLVNITASDSLRMSEVRAAMETIQNFADQDANVVHGTVEDQSMGDRIRVTVIATGLDQSDTDDTFVSVGRPAAVDAAPSTGGVWSPMDPAKKPTPAEMNVDLFGKPLEQKTPPKPVRKETASPFGQAEIPAAKPEPVKEEPVAKPQPSVSPIFGTPISRPDADEPVVPEQPPVFSFGSQASAVRPASDVFASMNPQNQQGSGLWTSAVKPAPTTSTEPQPKESKPSLDFEIPTFLRRK